MDSGEGFEKVQKSARMVYGCPLKQNTAVNFGICESENGVI